MDGHRIHDSRHVTTMMAPCCVTAIAAAAWCTMEMLSPARDSVATYLLGRATPDTVLAGAGSVLSSFPQRSYPAVYGQIVRVDSLSGPDANVARAALANRR